MPHNENEYSTVNVYALVCRGLVPLLAIVFQRNHKIFAAVQFVQL